MHTLDRAAITVSVLCVVHCMAIPVALLIMPAVALIDVHHHWVHWGLLGLAAPLSAVAFGSGFTKHRRLLVPALGALGLMLMAGAVTELFGAAAESPVTIVGASLLAAAHWVNQRLLHS